jgi:pilus assembly protein Flp/PilA
MHARDERGASAVEYGLLVAGIAAFIVAGVFLLGGMVKSTLFDSSCDDLAGHLQSSVSTPANCQN